MPKKPTDPDKIPANVETFPEGTPEPTLPLGPVQNPLYQKILAIMEEVERIPKLGRNTQGQGYDYLREADMMDAVRKAMLEQKVIRLPLVYKSIGTAKEAHVSISARWIDVESGEYHETEIEGFDVNGQNKASWAGYTGAIKYELRHLFMVPTGDDPEKNLSGKSEERGSSPSPSRGATGQRAPSPPASSSSGGDDATQEELDMLERLCRHHATLAECGCYPSEWAAGFMGDQIDRYSKHGDSLKFFGGQRTKFHSVWKQVSERLRSVDDSIEMSMDEIADLLGGE